VPPDGRFDAVHFRDVNAQPEDHVVLASRDELPVAFARHYTRPSPVKMERAAAEARRTLP
jgi:hypothetical protein